jgi:hypothetical protein
MDDGRPLAADPSVTSARLSSISDSINTTGKYQGKRVYCTSVAKFLHTNGSAPGEPWRNPDNTVAFAPA